MKKLFVIAIAALLSSCNEEVIVHVKVKSIKTNVTRVLPLKNGDFYAEGDTIVLGDLTPQPDTVTITQIYEE